MSSFIAIDKVKSNLLALISERNEVDLDDAKSLVMGCYARVENLHYEDYKDLLNKGLPSDYKYADDWAGELVAAYGLLTKYEVSKEQYIAWAKKAAKKDATLLDMFFRLIGEENAELKKEVKRQKREESRVSIKTVNDDKNLKSIYKDILKNLDNTPKILFEDDKGEIVICGNNYKASEDASAFGLFLAKLYKCYNLALEEFEKEFKFDCNGYEKCSQNLVDTFDFAFKEFCTEVSKQFPTIRLNEKSSNKLIKDCIKVANECHKTIIEELEKKYDDVYGKLMNGLYDLERQYEAEDTQFFAGGRGVGGLIGGAIASSIANTVSNSMKKAKYTNYGRDRVKQFKALMDEMYCGEDTYSFYVSILIEEFDDLKKGCVNAFFGKEDICLEPDQVLIEDLNEITRHIPEKEVKQLIQKLISAFPYSEDVLVFYENNISNSGGDVKRLEELFHTKEIEEELAEIKEDRPFVEILDWPFFLDSSTHLGYIEAAEAYANNCMAVIQKKKKKEYRNFVFRILFKRLLAHSDFDYCRSDRYGCLLANSPLIASNSNLLDNVKEKYCLYDSDAIMVFEDRAIISVDDEDISEIEVVFKDIEGIFISGAPILVKNPRSEEDYRLNIYSKSKKIKRWVAYASDLLELHKITNIINTILCYLSPTDNIGYRKSEGLDDFIFCNKCNTIAEMITDSSGFFNHRYCRRCRSELFLPVYICRNYQFHQLMDVLAETDFTMLKEGDIYDDEIIYSREWVEADWVEVRNIFSAYEKEQARLEEEALKKEEEEKKLFWFCQFCGKKISRSAKFCNFCGKRLSNE